ncbi:MAG: hypothetical protein OXI01_19195 [Albidovulum sp.]|nr:hypothetical protein [Albidovulum sp.]
MKFADLSLDGHDLEQSPPRLQIVLDNVAQIQGWACNRRVAAGGRKLRVLALGMLGKWRDE